MSPLHPQVQTESAPSPARRPNTDDMIWIPGGTFRMGSDLHYPEEAPARRVTVSGFWIDRYPVTNARFRRFVEATGHLTIAELPLDPADYPYASTETLDAGSLVFVKPMGAVDLRRIDYWWKLIAGANWRHPEGPGSSLNGRDRHPVVHVAFRDAERYAEWAGKSLPTEAEWEYAARGGLEDKAFAWGDELTLGGRHMANTWQGQFPWQNLIQDGYTGTSPVDTFPANGFRIYDMIGNVWEWTTDCYQPRHRKEAATPCCIPPNPRGGDTRNSGDAYEPATRITRRVLKGGSHLCSPSYCRRYRPAARFPAAIDTSTCHVGFRCVLRPGDIDTASP